MNGYLQQTPILFYTWFYSKEVGGIMMNEKQEIVAVSLHQTDSSAKESGNKTPQKLKISLTN